MIARAGVVDHRHGLARGVVRQAEDRDVGGVEHFGAARRVLALGVAQVQQLDVAAAAEPLGICRPVVPASPSMNTFGVVTLLVHHHDLAQKGLKSTAAIEAIRISPQEYPGLTARACHPRRKRTLPPLLARRGGRGGR